MAFLTEQALHALGLKKLGLDVKISEKASIYNANQIEIGDYSRIDDFCVLSGKIVIGRNVHIAVFCNLAGGEKGILMEDFSGLAYGVQVFTQSDDYSGQALTNPTVPSQYKNETKKPIFIKKHSIIGAHSLIFPGVTIETGTSVGAMSMVTKSTQSWSIYFGVPAKKIKNRRRTLIEFEHQLLDEEGA